MKLKQLVLAALAVSAMGSAMAQVTGSASTSTLEVMVADGNSSYVYNTGISLAALAAGTVTQTVSLPNWSYATEFTSGVFDPVSNQSGVQWGLIGATFGNGATDSIMVTAGPTTPSASYINNSLKTDASTLQQNLFTFPSGVAQSSSSAGYAAPGTFFEVGGYGGVGENQGLVDGVNTSTLYYETLVPNATGIVKPNTLAKVVQVNEGVSFDASTGTLTLTGAAAAVPEPSRLVLMLAGLGVIGFVARRRTSV